MSWLGKVRFFLGVGGVWEILVFFSKRSVSPPLRVNKKNSWPPIFRWLTKLRPSPHYWHGMFYAIETSRNFACGRKMFEYKYISILNVSKLKQENANSQCFRAEVWIWKHKLWDWVIHSPATPTPRPYPDYSKLPDFYRLPGTAYHNIHPFFIVIKYRGLEPLVN